MRNLVRQLTVAGKLTDPWSPHRKWRSLTLTLLLVLMVFSVVATAAQAGVGSGWEVSGWTGPTVLAPGSTGKVWFLVDNTGAAENTGGTLTDTLPAGLKATGGENCTGETVVVCSIPPLPPGDGEPYHLSIPVRVVATQPGEEVNSVTVGGGGAAAVASTSFPVKYGTTPAAAGFSSFDAWFSNADGSVDTQAGSHPYQFTLRAYPYWEDLVQLRRIPGRSVDRT